MLVLQITLMVLFFSFQSLFTRLYSANYAGEEGQSTAVFSICYGVFIAVATLAVGGFSFAPSWQTWLFGLLNAGMLLLYNTSMIEAGNRGSYSFLMVSSMFGGILVPMAVGVMFLGETLTGLQVFAVVLMLVSLVAMNVRGISFQNNSGSYYLWCAALFFSNGLYGVIMNLQANAMAGAQRTEMLTILFAASALSAVVMELARKRGRQLVEGFRMGKKAALFLLICCASATAAANLLLVILHQMESSILYTIDNGGVLVLSILYSLVLFKERPRWEQVAGMVMAVGSIVLINLG